MQFCNLTILFLIVLVIALAYITYYHFYENSNSIINGKIESFKANSNITNMELMNFDYITNKNYYKSIVTNYYNDKSDARSNYSSIIPTPLAYPYTKDNEKYYYGTGQGTTNGLNPNFALNANALPPRNPARTIPLAQNQNYRYILRNKYGYWWV
jgi:hypothetical protein